MSWALETFFYDMIIYFPLLPLIFFINDTFQMNFGLDLYSLFNFYIFHMLVLLFYILRDFFIFSN
jgi:hypothetical protein